MPLYTFTLFDRHRPDETLQEELRSDLEAVRRAEEIAHDRLSLSRVCITQEERVVFQVPGRSLRIGNGSVAGAIESSRLRVRASLELLRRTQT